MSEFKFACPVCGQHITADSAASGTQLECPTCFQKIIVPQAPASGEAKFILSARKRRTARVSTLPEAVGAQAPASKGPLPVLVPASILLLAGLGVAAWFLWDGKILPRSQPQAQLITNAPPKPSANSVAYSVPTNVAWTLALTNAFLPEATVAGSIHGQGFLCEHATLQGGNLGLRQGHWPPDLGLNVQFFANLGEELAGKTVEITPDRTPPLPRVVLRWKNDQRKPVNKTFNSGYALRVVFGQPANNRMPGKLYLALPDEEQSFVAGTFIAEIRKPPPPKPAQPKTAPPKPKPLPPPGE